MIAQNLLTAEETRQYRELGIADRLQSQRNRAYSQVAIAPTKPLPLLEPTQVSAPSNTGMYLGIANAGLGMIGWYCRCTPSSSNRLTYGNPRNSIPTWSGLV